MDGGPKKNSLASSYGELSVDDVLSIGDFQEEFIRVKYNSNEYDYQLSLAMMDDGMFFNCITHKLVIKAFDSKGSEVSLPIKNFNYYVLDKSSDISI